MPIDGTWYNELGSTMNIVSDGTTITGTYVTPVGDASGTYALAGSINTDTDPAVAWVVLWSNESGDSNSVTVWAGQYFSDQGPEVIISMWLLRSEAPTEGQNWAATQVGEDVFTRNQQQAGVHRPAISVLRAPSHPV